MGLEVYSYVGVPYESNLLRAFYSEKARCILLYRNQKMNIIEVKNLTFSYDGERNVLDGLNLSVKKGEFIAIVGRNGSGKSTLARHFNALNLPSCGSVVVCGFDTRKNPFEIRKRAGMVFQNPDNQMVASLVEDEVAFAPENLGVEPEEIRKRVDESLETVGMSDMALRPTANLSGGEKQRVAIAGVIAMQPEIIILDEATAMLDPKGRREVMEAIHRINNAGTTVIHITHHMEEAAMAERVIVMDNGTIALDATPSEVFAQTKLLKLSGLDVPLMAQLSALLRESGVDISEKILSVDEMLDELVKIKNDKI